MENSKKLPKEIEDILREPLDAKAITKHPTKTYLSSIKAIYVTERFNKAFGIGGWSTKVEYIADGGSGMIVVKVVFTVPEYGIYYECFGGNDNGGENSKNFDLGDAYKGATTDALTKIGSYLEVGINVFKGLGDKAPAYTPATNGTAPATNGTAPANNAATPPEETKPWLNKTYKNSTDLTKEWLNVLDGIDSGKITDVAKVREVYAVNKAIAAEIENEIAFRQPA
jgi:hypothetical protein